MLDFIRIACAVPEVKVGDVKKNASDICSFMEKADAQKALLNHYKGKAVQSLQYLYLALTKHKTSIRIKVYTKFV